MFSWQPMFRLQGGALPPIGTAPWCMIPSTLGSNPGGSGDEPDGVTITETTVNTTKLKIYKQMTIKFKKILEKAVQPVRTNGAGYNLVATDIATDVNERGQVNIVYRTGIGVEIPEGYVGIINTPADIYKKTLRMCSSPILSGNIDEEVIVRYMNTTDVVPAVYKDGDTVANLTIVKAEDVEFEEFIDTTSSATESEQGLPETEGEPTNPDITEAVSGGETNIPEQAQ